MYFNKLPWAIPLAASYPRNEHVSQRFRCCKLHLRSSISSSFRSMYGNAVCVVKVVVYTKQRRVQLVLQRPGKLAREVAKNIL